MSNLIIAAAIIVEVILWSALIYLLEWRVGRKSQRIGRDPKYYRRSMYLAAAFFLLPTIVEMVAVSNGTESKSHLLAVPFLLGLALCFFKLGRHAKVSP